MNAFLCGVGATVAALWILASLWLVLEHREVPLRLGEWRYRRRIRRARERAVPPMRAVRLCRCDDVKEGP